MREIKFRGVSRDNGELIYGDLVRNMDGSPMICYYEITHPTMQDPCGDTVKKYEVVNPDSVGQYTGLKDKNGKEVYDGDIRGGTYYCDNEQVSTLEVIEWDNDGMCYWWRRLKGGSMPDFIQTEIVGNIYETPELLQP